MKVQFRECSIPRNGLCFDILGVGGNILFVVLALMCSIIIKIGFPSRIK